MVGVISQGLPPCKVEMSRNTIVGKQHFDHLGKSSLPYGNDATQIVNMSIKENSLSLQNAAKRFLSMNPFSLGGLFFHCRPHDATLENFYFQTFK